MFWDMKKLTPTAKPVAKHDSETQTNLDLNRVSEENI